jgi:hypothetical protein
MSSDPVIGPLDLVIQLERKILTGLTGFTGKILLIVSKDPV